MRKYSGLRYICIRGDGDPVEDLEEDGFLEFDNLFGDAGEEELPPSEPPATVEPEGEEGQEVTDPAPANAEVPVQPEGADPTLAPTSDQEVKPEPVVEPVSAKPTPEQEQAQLDALRTDLQKAYTMTEDQVDQFLTDPGPLVADMMAQMHMSILSQCLQMVSKVIPQQIEQVGVAQTRQRELETTWSEVNPDLNLQDQAVVGVLGDAVRLVRTQYPTLDTKGQMEKAGIIARTVLGLQSPSAQQQPVIPTPQPKPVPTVGRKLGTRVPETPQASPWESVMKEFEED